MKTEFNLSEKRIEANLNDNSQAKYREKDVKEFIDLLKKEVDKDIGTFIAKYQAEIIKNKINMLVGEKLI